VRKSDGSWHLNYRALNRVTIKDKFPIPIVEELLNELQTLNQARPQIRLSSGVHEHIGHQEDGLPDSRGPLRIFGHAIRPHERAGHLSSPNE
jgi:hypothetical protein